MYKPIIDHMSDLIYSKTPDDIENFGINICVYFKNEFSDDIFNFPLLTIKRIQEIVYKEKIYPSTRSFIVHKPKMDSIVKITKTKIELMVGKISGETKEEAINKLTSFIYWEYEDIEYDIWLSESIFIEKKNIGTIKPVLDNFQILNDYCNIENFELEVTLQISDESKKNKLNLFFEIITLQKLYELVEKENIVYCKGKFIVNEIDMELNINLVKIELENIFEDCKRKTWKEVLIALSRYFDLSKKQYTTIQ